MRLTIILLAALLVACGPSADTQPPPPAGVLRVGLAEPVLPGDRMITGALWTPLVDYDPATGTLTPRAATEVTTADQITWTIKVKPGKYTDGRPLTAQSYVDAWHALPLLKAAVAIDEQTIRLTLGKPRSDLPAFLASPAALPYRDDPMIGNGPFRLAGRWEPGKGGRLVRVQDFPGRPGEIELRVVGSAEQAYDEVRAGTLDLAVEVPGSRHEAMHRDFATRHVIWAEPTFTYLSFGADAPEAAARFAISMSLDRKALAAGPMAEQVDPATALIPPAMGPGDRQGVCRACNSDPAAAKSLREQAGLTGVRIEGSAPIAEEVHTKLGVPTDSGVSVRVRTQTFQTLSPAELFEQLNVPSVHQFLDAAAASGDPAERAQQYRLAENQILRDLPVIPLWSGHGHAIWGERVRGVQATPAHGVELAAISL
jgi:oligopeptide transport system substrate-binding protein